MLMHKFPDMKLFFLLLLAFPCVIVCRVHKGKNISPTFRPQPTLSTPPRTPSLPPPLRFGPQPSISTPPRTPSFPPPPRFRPPPSISTPPKTLSFRPPPQFRPPPSISTPPKTPSFQPPPQFRPPPSISAPPKTPSFPPPPPPAPAPVPHSDGMVAPPARTTSILQRLVASSFGRISIGGVITYVMGYVFYLAYRPPRDPTPHPHSESTSSGSPRPDRLPPRTPPRSERYSSVITSGLRYFIYDGFANGIM